MIALLLECKDHTADLVQAVADGAEEEVDADLLAIGSDIIARLTDAVARAQSVREKLNAEQADTLAAWTEKHAVESDG